MTTLSDFTDDTDEEPPACRKCRPVHPRWAEKVLGFSCDVLNRGPGVDVAGDYPRGYVAKKDRGTSSDWKHYVWKLEAYAFSERLLKTLAREGSEYIFVWERDVGDVFESKLGDWITAVEVPWTEGTSDQQRFVSERKMRKWPDLGSMIWEHVRTTPRHIDKGVGGRCLTT